MIMAKMLTCVPFVLSTLFDGFTDSRPISEPIRRVREVRAQTVVLSESGNNFDSVGIEHREKRSRMIRRIQVI